MLQACTRCFGASSAFVKRSHCLSIEDEACLIGESLLAGLSRAHRDEICERIPRRIAATRMTFWRLGYAQLELLRFRFGFEARAITTSSRLYVRCGVDR